MRFSQALIATITLLSTPISAVHIPRAQLDARSDVDDCKALLVALKASAFCSSFVPITDISQTASPPSTQVTVTAPCTNAARKRQPSTTPAAPSTTAKISTTPVMPSSTSKVSTTSGPFKTTTPKTSSTTSTVAKCSIEGLPSAVRIFACEVIKEACLAFVKPKAVTIPGKAATNTKTVTPTCSATTTPSRTPSTTLSTTASTTSSAAAQPTTCNSDQSIFCKSQQQNTCLCQLDVDGVTPVCSNGAACPQTKFPNPPPPCASDLDCVLDFPGSTYTRCVYTDLDFFCTPTYCATEDGCNQQRLI